MHSSEGSNGLIDIGMNHQHFQHVCGVFQKQKAQTAEHHICIAILSTESNHASPDSVLVDMACCDEM